jgi:serine/threonine-protein kinase
MTNEVRSKLSALSGLAVVASSSSGQYKATTKPPEQVAKELGVGYLLSAKVQWQKSGPTSRIRVTPELVEVGGGGVPTTRWQEAFDGDLADVFKVQGEIAGKVAKSLAIVLSGKERGDLSSRPTSNLAAYDAYLKGMEIRKKPGILFIKPAVAQFDQAVALDPHFALAWAESSLSHSAAYVYSDPSIQQAEAARIGAERAVELAPNLPRASLALASYHSSVKEDKARAFAVLSHALKANPNDVELLGVASGYEQDIGKRIDLLRRVEALDPRSEANWFRLAVNFQNLRSLGEARAACDRGLALRAGNLDLVRIKAMTYLQEGDLAGARAAIAAAPADIGPTDLVAYLGTVWDLDWVLDESQRDLLLRLTPASFDDNQGTWGIVLAQAASRRGDQAKVREYAEEARKSLGMGVVQNPNDADGGVFFGLALAYLGRKEEAVREGEHAVALRPIPKSDFDGHYTEHQLVRIYILTGNHEKALELLATLLSIPGYLTPAWLRIDPNFDPLRGNPRFEKLARGK